MPPARRAESAAARRGPCRGGARPRARVTHSLEAIVDAAIALLDEAGEPALTFRGLAARLGGGVGSIYWYVSSKEELLDRATDEVMGQLLAASDSDTDGADPFANLRALGVTLYRGMTRRPWLANYLMRSVDLQPNSMRLYERFGQQVQRLDLTTRQRFHAVSAIVSYVVGVGAELGQGAPEGVVDDDGRNAFLHEFADSWRALDPQEFPFVHEVAGEFERHQDVEQFVAGLDLLLAGLRLQAGA